MPYPLNFAKKNIETTTSKRSAPPGVYDSVLVHIEPAPGYVPGDGYLFTYQLTSEKTGQRFEKTETFLNDSCNERFITIVDEVTNGGFELSDVEDLLGLHERVTLAYEAVRGRSYLNITEREFIDFQTI